MNKIIKFIGAFCLLIMFVLILSSCNLDGDVPSNETLNTTIPPVDIAQLIQQAYEEIDKNEIAYPYNMEKANALEKQLPTGLFIEQKKLKKDAKSELELLKLKGLAYIRLGEQENCFAGNPDACVIPVLASNSYTQKPATKQAIKIYEDILRKHPKDKEALWLLNLAYMVLGEYPNRIAEQWRIPIENFKSTRPLDKFPNIAAKAGVDALGLAGGCAFDDFNKDGYMDIITATADPNQSVQYFQNKGNGTFEDKTQVANLGNIAGGLNIVHADYNNDSYLDVLIRPFNSK